MRKKILSLSVVAALFLGACGSSPSTTTPATLEVLTTIVPTAVQGTQYSMQLQATGGTAPYSWKVTAGALPEGLTLSSSGVISGVPSGQGQFSFTVEVVDSSTAAPASANFKSGGTK